MTMRNETQTNNNNVMPTVNKRLLHFYDHLKEVYRDPNFYFRFSNKQHKLIRNRIKILYDRGVAEGKYKPVSYTVINEEGREIQVRDYPEGFHLVIDVVIQQAFDKLKENVEREAKLGNREPMQRIIGRLSPRVRRQINPIQPRKGGDDKNHKR